jgi:DNA polymerase-1
VASDLVRQLQLLPQLLAAFGFPRFGVAGFEADDVLATLARKLGERGEDVLIASGDRDSLQLVRERTHVLFMGRRGAPEQRYDRAAVVARFGLPPEQLPSYVALVGDPSDNLPKLPGIGPRTAQALIAEHGSAAALLQNLSAVSNARLRATLSEHAELLLRNERLARLRDDLPLNGAQLTAPFTEAARAATAALLQRLEFASLLPRLAALPASPDPAPA